MFKVFQTNRKEDCKSENGSISETHIEPGPRSVVPNPSRLDARDWPHRHRFILHVISHLNPNYFTRTH
ncbi:hypothetical protein RHGRI_023375 [Rhododendron griersonianum]|uniref:Uncharacterized protein n=1 Tax=Rhododendron griersonianum TaxID=479676 RepID=A0AAV6J7U2_9ERIC|nr:hypothetical protein RHGRI_023375 [Rhododendron griersonianum]